MDFKKGDLIRVTNKVYNLSDKPYEVISSEYFGVFIKEYPRMILKSDIKKVSE